MLIYNWSIFLAIWNFALKFYYILKISIYAIKFTIFKSCTKLWKPFLINEKFFETSVHIIKNPPPLVFGKKCRKGGILDDMDWYRILKNFLKKIEGLGSDMPPSKACLWKHFVKELHNKNPNRQEYASLYILFLFVLNICDSYLSGKITPYVKNILEANIEQDH